MLISALQEVACRTDIDKTSAVINALVRHLSFKWRTNFARQVATKFNCFFLMTFMEEFSEFLRVELQKVYDGSSSLLGVDGECISSLFDIGEMKDKLEVQERELERELEQLLLLKRKRERSSTCPRTSMASSDTLL